MRIRLHGARWILLVLYALMVLVFWVIGLGIREEFNQTLILGMLVLMLGSQAIFVLCTGTRDLLKPVRRKRTLFWPVVVAAGMMMLLMIAFSISMVELFRCSSASWVDSLLWCLVVTSWIGWGIFFFIHTRARERFEAMRRMTKFVLAGSLAELLACIPSHIIVSRRPGCLVGLGTGMGVAAGVYVMFWSFGPGILLLFLRPKRDEEARLASEGVVKEPVRHGPRYSLAGLMLFVLFLSSSMAAVLTPAKDLSLTMAALFGGWFIFHSLRQLRTWEREP